MGVCGTLEALKSAAIEQEAGRLCLGRPGYTMSMEDLGGIQRSNDRDFDGESARELWRLCNDARYGRPSSTVAQGDSWVNTQPE